MSEGDPAVRKRFFDAVIARDVASVVALLAVQPELARARARGDATLLDGRVWVDRAPTTMAPEDSSDAPALHFAAFHGDVELARALLEAGADVHALGYENNHDQTPAIVLAAWEGGLEMLALLLEHGADPNAISGNGVTPLSTALRHDKTDRVELLRRFGARG